jgi:hypothetical protein
VAVLPVPILKPVRKHNRFDHLFFARRPTPALGFQDFFHLARFTFRIVCDANNRFARCGMGSMGL